MKAATPEELAKRKAHFAAAHAAIKNHNKKNSTFTMGHSKFSAMVTSLLIFYSAYCNKIKFSCFK